MTARSPRAYYKALASSPRLMLLHELQNHGPATLAELAAATGLHRNTARGHLHLLIETGFVRSEPILRGGRGRPELRYRTTTEPDDRERHDRRRAVDARIGGRLPRSGPPAAHQLGVLRDHMDQSGFTATIDARTPCMTMRDCPFVRLAGWNPRVCEVHHALIADALRLADGPLRAGALHRFSSEGTCTLDLVDTTSSAPSRV